MSTFIALSPVNTPYPAVLDCIVKYESGGQQFRKDGTPLWSPTHDVGVMQINQVHLKEAQHMGLDIVNNPKDNIEYGIWLYNTAGPNQWTTYRKYCKGGAMS